MTFFNHVVTPSGERSLAILFDDGNAPTTVASSHPNFDKIKELFDSGQADDESVRELVNTLHSVGQKLSRLTERITASPYGLFFDGDPVHGALAETILAVFNGNDDQEIEPLLNFLEKVQQNPSLKSIDDLYRWIRNGDLTITPNGDFIGYKGVQVRADGVSESIHRGKATTNGVVYNGHIPNPDGAIVEMPRSEVDPDSKTYCSVGLHVANYRYAESWGNGRTILVQVNPRDVIAVPEDSNGEKMRVCRYIVLEHTDSRLDEKIYSGDYIDDGFEASDDEDRPVDEPGGETCECDYCLEWDEPETEEERDLEEQNNRFFF